MRLSLAIIVALLRICAALCFFAPCSLAQSADDLNLQFHGYATQAFIYTDHNDWNTTDSSDGSAAWTEAVVNLTTQPEPKLRIGIQARYFLLGDYGNRITLDWASGEYKVNEHLGFRVGKVKSPTGMLNETQDIDPVHLWILLPQSVYPIASRNAILSHYGGIVFGAVPLGEAFGKLEYRVYGGERVISSDDGYLEPLRAYGITVPNGLKGRTYGGSLRWKTPLPGLMLGAANGSEQPSGTVTLGPVSGTLTTSPFNYPFFFGSYEHNKIMFAAEYNRNAVSSPLAFPGFGVQGHFRDQRNFYVMASYKIARKLTGGAYYSSQIDKQAAFDTYRYQKDWTISARYDFDSFLYLKAEQHFLDGTAIGFSSTSTNLQETSRMSLIKLGVTF